MKKIIVITLLAIVFVVSCEKEQDPFLISNKNIGFLTDSTQVKDLQSVFINDSISKYIDGDEFIGNINDINIFDKTGNLMLVLSPSQS